MTKRIVNHKILGKQAQHFVPFYWNNEKYYGIEGESVTAALLANNIRVLRHHESSGSSRGLYCNIGQCSECRVTINEKINTRACITPLSKNMEIKPQDELAKLIKGD